MNVALTRFGRIAFLLALVATMPGCQSADDPVQVVQADQPKPGPNPGPEMPTPFPQPQPQPHPEGRRHLEVIPVQTEGFPRFAVRQVGPTIVFSQIERGRKFEFRIRDNGKLLTDLRCPANDLRASVTDRVSIYMPQDPDVTSIQTYCATSHGNIYIEGTARAGFSSGVAMPQSPVSSNRWEPVSGQADMDGDIVLAVQADGSPVAGLRVGFVTAKYHSDGSKDHTFSIQPTVVGNPNVSGIDIPRLLLVDRDGTFYVFVHSVSSEVLGYADIVESFILKFTKTGELDSRFGHEGKLKIEDDAFRIVVKSAYLERSGRLTLAYNRCTTWNNCELVIRRLRSSGFWDHIFGSRGKLVVAHHSGDSEARPRILPGPNNSIVYLEERDDSSSSDFFVSRYTDSGGPDPSFRTGIRKLAAPGVDGVNCSLSDAKTDSDSRIVLMGYCGASHMTVMRLRADGQVDATFGSNGVAPDRVDTGQFFSMSNGTGPSRCEPANPHGGTVTLLDSGELLVVSPTATDPRPDEMGSGCFSAALGIGFFLYDSSGKLKKEFRPPGFIRTWHEVPHESARVTLVTSTGEDSVLAVLGLGGEGYRIAGDPRPATFFVQFNRLTD